MGFFSKLFGKKDDPAPDTAIEAAIETPTLAERDAEAAGHDHAHDEHDHAHDHGAEGHDHTH